MGDNNESSKSRRWFLTGGLGEKNKKEMVKMLTADGKVVEVEKSIVEAASQKQKATNSEIYQWMNNPSKKD